MDVRLTPTSYVVLGLLERLGEATPYELKQRVAAGIGNFWTLQHSQLYAEPERLAKAGYVSERREETGRRRRRYSVTAKGRAALAEWLTRAEAPPTELRHLGLLKVFLGADPAAIAPAQVAHHRAKLEEYEAMRAAAPGDFPRGPVLALEAGIGHEREWVRFWEALAAEGGAGDAEGDASAGATERGAGAGRGAAA